MTEIVLEEDHQNDGLIMVWSDLIKLERSITYHFSRLREEQLTRADGNYLWSQRCAKIMHLSQVSHC